MTATGFHAGFRNWWFHLRKVFHDSPAVLPCAPPGFEQANAILLEFTHQYRELEQSLQQARLQQAMERRSKDPLLIYRDLQRERAEPVQTIVVAKPLKILASQPSQDDKIELTLETPIPDGAYQLSVSDVNFQPQVVSATRVVVPSETAQQCGDHILCKQVEGNVNHILQAFEDEWSPRWSKHDHVSSDRWNAISEFLEVAIPKRVATFPPITRELWRKTVAKKKKYAAIGADGVSKHDLQNMPDVILDDLLNMLQKIEQGAEWPSQAMTGMVAALAKTPQAQTTNQYRPICIFSLFLRVWGTIRAKQCLRYLATLVPSTLLGNIPGRSPKQLWFRIQQAIEYAYAQDSEIAGCVADLVKCFNTLPRVPLLQLAAHLGIPTEVLVPWSQSLSQVQRRFQVRGAVGKPLPSTTGFPEGDAMSVVAMAICNVACEVFMLHKSPKIQTWSYVDNLETLARHAYDAIQSLELLDEFCRLMDLQIDFDKSYVWSNSPAGRKLIRDSDFVNKLFARDLGGHLNYTKLRTNFTLQEKIHMFSPFWQRLCRSFAPASQKERALVVAAWPNLFYGICTVTMGMAHFDKLRTQACKALNLTQNGLNPLLQLSCVGNPKADPEFFCVMNTIMSFRECSLADMSEFVLAQLQNGQSMTPGPCSSFLKALDKIFWRWKGHGICLDQHGLPCHLFACSKMEIQTRLVEAWQQRVFGLMSECRKTMTGIQNADARLTTQCLATLPANNVGLMRCALNGTQFTNDSLVHSGLVSTSACKFCGEPDSAKHRHWHCSFFHDIRSKYLAISELSATAEPCLLNHGWLPSSPNLVAFRQELLRLKDTSGIYMQPPSSTQETSFKDLFTDGSCLRPSDPLLRVSTWGVVEWNGDRFWPVANGGVPTWKQTSLRAEIFAVLAALKICMRSIQPCRIWTDNAEVFHVLTELVAGRCTDHFRKPDADLWFLVVQQLQQCDHRLVAVFKVKSHLDPQEQDSVLDAWATDGNQQADRCAEHARQTLPTELWKQWSLVFQHNQDTLQQGRLIHAMYVEIAEKARQTTTLSTLDEPTGPESAAALQLDPGVQHMATLSDEEIPRHFRNEETRQVLAWLSTLTQPTQPTTWVSFHQLLVDYQLYSGRLGPSSHKGKWLETPRDQPYSHKQHTLWLSQFLKNLSQHTHVPITIEQRRPPSHMLAFWCGTISINISLQRLNAVDNHFQRHTVTMPIRQIAKDLANMVPGFS